VRVKQHRKKSASLRNRGASASRIEEIQGKLGLNGQELAARIFHDRSTIADVLNKASSEKTNRKIVGLAEMLLQLEELQGASSAAGYSRSLSLQMDDGTFLEDVVWSNCRRRGAKAFRLSETGYSEWFPSGSIVVAYSVKSCSEGDLCMILLKGSKRCVLKRVYVRGSGRVMLCSLKTDMVPEIELSRNSIVELLKVWSITANFSQ
jgi:hypothetical protein